LISADERGYQAGLVAILLRQGHRVLYVSPHSSLEHGKDIVTLAPDGALCAYQLKVGDIGTTDWRDIQGEVLEACLIPFQNLKPPANAVRKADRVILVLTGRVKDPVRNKIELINADHQIQGIAPISLLEIDDLVALFAERFESFMPASTAGASEAIALAAADGRGWPNKPALCRLFDGILAKRGRTRVSTRRALADLIVAADFASVPFVAAENHIAALDVWTIAATHLVGAVSGIENRWTADFLAIARERISTYSSDLWTSTIDIADFSLGRMGDELVVDFRTQVVLGYLSATLNARVIDGLAESEARSESAALVNWLRRPDTRLMPWSEGAWGVFLNLLLALRHTQLGVNLSITFAERWLDLCAPGERGFGFRDPYFTVEDAIEALLIPQQVVAEELPASLSYSLEPLLHFLARRDERRAVATRWKRISRLDRAEFVPGEAEELAHWTVESGFIRQRPFPLTGSWTAIRDAALERPSTFLSGAQWLLPFFMCAYPHRVSCELSASLDYLTGAGRSKERWH